MKEPKISIVFSVFNEINLHIFKESLINLSSNSAVEIIVVDGGSTDGTVELVETFPVTLIKTNYSSRAKRLNTGISQAKSDLVLLHHPRSLIDTNGLNYLFAHYDDLSWGGFSHGFIEKHPIYSFTSWYSNEVRGKLRSIIYLDHCIFFKKSLLGEDHFVPDLVIFEDTKFSEKLNAVCPCVIIPYLSKTSAIRFSKNGMVRQVLLNLVMKICYLLNLSDDSMNRVYEKGLGLNTRY